MTQTELVLDKELQKAEEAESSRRRQAVMLLHQLRMNDTTSVRAKVVKILSEDPYARDCDLHLTIRVFEHFYPELVWEMMRSLAADVIATEIETGRLSPPFRVRLIKDADPSQDQIRLKHFEERFQDILHKFPETKWVEIQAVRAENSKSFVGLQIAVAGSFSKFKNGLAGLTPKTELAKLLLNHLGFLDGELLGPAKDNVSCIDYRDAKRRPNKFRMSLDTAVVADR